MDHVQHLLQTIHLVVSIKHVNQILNQGFIMKISVPKEQPQKILSQVTTVALRATMLLSYTMGQWHMLAKDKNVHMFVIIFLLLNIIVTKIVFGKMSSVQLITRLTGV